MGFKHFIFIDFEFSPFWETKGDRVRATLTACSQRCQGAQVTWVQDEGVGRCGPGLAKQRLPARATRSRMIPECR